MKNIFTLLGLFIIVLCSAQPGTPDANGVITAGPPWVTGVQQGDGELKLQFTYLNAAILLNDAEIAVIEDSITDISARSISNSDHTNLSNIGTLTHANLDTELRDTFGIYVGTSHGMVADASTDNGPFLQAAVDAAGFAGGGIVLIPAATLAYYFETTVYVDSSNVKIYGQGDGTQLSFRNGNGMTEGLYFKDPTGSKQMFGNAVKDLTIWANEDTINVIKMDRSYFSNIHNVRIRSTSGSADQRIGIKLSGKGAWGGGTNIDRVLTSQLFNGILIDSVCNNNMITNSWFVGETGIAVNSTGVLLQSDGSENSDANIIMNCDFESYEVAIQSDQSFTRVTDNRFEGNDTCIQMTLVNGAWTVKGNHYADGVDYTVVGGYGIRMDAGHPIDFGRVGNDQPIINMYGSGATGASMQFYNSSVGANELLQFTTHSGASHTNVMGETISINEGLISSDYPFKIGTTVNFPFMLYANGDTAIEIQGDQDVWFHQNILVEDDIQAQQNILANEVLNANYSDQSVLLTAKKTITYLTDGVEDTICVIPIDAILWEIRVEVTTGFTDTGTDLLDIGVAATSDHFLNDEDVTSTGFLGITTTNTPYHAPGVREIVAVYNGQNGNAGAGVADIYVKYSMH